MGKLWRRRVQGWEEMLDPSGSRKAGKPLLRGYDAPGAAERRERPAATRAEAGTRGPSSTARGFLTNGSCPSCCRRGFFFLRYHLYYYSLNFCPFFFVWKAWRQWVLLYTPPPLHVLLRHLTDSQSAVLSKSTCKCIQPPG